MILGTFPLACFLISVGRSWPPVISHYSSRWVCCSQLSLLVCSRNVCCSCWPPIEPSPRSLRLRFVLSCSPPRCILSLTLRLICCPLLLDSLADLLPHFQGYQCILGPSGFLSLCRLREESSHSGQSTCPEAALLLGTGVPFVEWPLASG